MTATPHRSRPVTRGIFFSHSIGYTHIRGLPASAAASTLAPQPFPRILYVYGAAHWLQAVHAAERLTNKDKKKTRKKVHARAAPPPPPPQRAASWGGERAAPLDPRLPSLASPATPTAPHPSACIRACHLPPQPSRQQLSRAHPASDPLPPTHPPHSVVPRANHDLGWRAGGVPLPPLAPTRRAFGGGWTPPPSLATPPERRRRGPSWPAWPPAPGHCARHAYPDGPRARAWQRRLRGRAPLAPAGAPPPPKPTAPPQPPARRPDQRVALPFRRAPSRIRWWPPLFARLRRGLTSGCGPPYRGLSPSSLSPLPARPIPLSIANPISPSPVFFPASSSHPPTPPPPTASRRPPPPSPTVRPHGQVHMRRGGLPLPIARSPLPPHPLWAAAARGRGGPVARVPQRGLLPRPRPRGGAHCLVRRAAGAAVTAGGAGHPRVWVPFWGQGADRQWSGGTAQAARPRRPAGAGAAPD